MKTLVVILILFGMGGINSLRAEQANSCKICQEQHKACVLAHSRAACATEYDVCMKHCRRK